ncbi:hypothetical protein QYE76_039514 [Lolium multiflorum]|uniref:TF-B3 domain-containing protein n=1 Tax=Lolium multiflorum TaxID=4521 RepID=A0AAD8TA15_LOLMU|nr:hypothetical protein QYE76_039514 [Lolium multiflorum]
MGFAAAASLEGFPYCGSRLRRLCLGHLLRFPARDQRRSVVEGWLRSATSTTAGRDHFLKIIFKPTFGRLLIPKASVKWFGEIPSNIIVTTNTGCNWRMTTRRKGIDTFIDHGWTAFAVAHHLKVGQFVTFRKVSSLEYSVVIFDHTSTEVVSRCLYHGDDTRCIVSEHHV